MALKKKRKAAKAKKRVAKKRPAPKKKAIKRKAPSKARKTKAARRPKVKPAAAKKPKEAGTVIGAITHYFPHVQAAVTKLKGPLSVGDTIKVKGHTTDFTQTVDSMQIDHVAVSSAQKGAEIGFGVISRVRQHDVIYKI